MFTAKDTASWEKILNPEFEKPYMRSLISFLENETFYPSKDLVFNAFCQTSWEDMKVVIVGQDPYHGFGQAHGLSFSVPKGIPLPPSLKNIFKEIEREFGTYPKGGDLINWARQGVLLLNATLTVRPGEAKSHHGRGWELFTKKVLELISQREDPVVFLLWGRSAIETLAGIDVSRHLMLKAPHPSPLSAYHGFFGCDHFLLANEFLKKNGKSPIDWV